LEQADASDYGMQASVFARDIQRVFQAIKRLNSGGVMINETPAYRADHMPYGGNRRVVWGVKVYGLPLRR
jgi:acyl-CoA reductase-like NAD-dependent aldehyde dehydrogenase